MQANREIERFPHTYMFECTQNKEDVQKNVDEFIRLEQNWFFSLFFYLFGWVEQIAICIRNKFIVFFGIETKAFRF